MDLVSIIRIVLKRWKVVAPVVLLTVAAAAKIYTDSTTAYAVTGTHYLITDSDQRVATPSEGEVIGLLTELLTQQSLRQQLESEGLTARYNVLPGATARTIQLVIIGTSAEQAVDTAARLRELAPDVLADALGENVAEQVVIDEPTPGTADDAVARDDGTFRYATILVVGSDVVEVHNPFPVSSATMRTLISVSGSLPFRQQVAQAAPGVTYQLTQERDTPLLNITASAPSAEAARSGYDTVLDVLGSELDRMQADLSVHPSARTRLRTLVPAQLAGATTTSQVRPVAAVTILGGGLAIGLAVALEALSAERRRQSNPNGVAPSKPTDVTERPATDGPVESPNHVPPTARSDLSPTDSSRQPRQSRPARSRKPARRSR